MCIRDRIQLKDAYRTSDGGEEAGLKIEYTEGDDGSYSHTYTDDTGVTHTFREDGDGYRDTVSYTVDSTEVTPPSSLKSLLPSNLEEFKELLGTASIDIDAENDEEDEPKYTVQLGPYKNVKVDLSDVLKEDSLDGVLEMIQTKMLETARGEDEHDDS